MEVEVPLAVFTYQQWDRDLSYRFERGPGGKLTALTIVAGGPDEEMDDNLAPVAKQLTGVAIEGELDASIRKNVKAILPARLKI
jgi:hypothetical protein